MRGEIVENKFSVWICDMGALSRGSGCSNGRWGRRNGGLSTRGSFQRTINCLCSLRRCIGTTGGSL